MRLKFSSGTVQNEEQIKFYNLLKKVKFLWVFFKFFSTGIKASQKINSEKVRPPLCTAKKNSQKMCLDKSNLLHPDRSVSSVREFFNERLFYNL